MTTNAGRVLMPAAITTEIVHRGVNLLLGAGADATARNRYGATPLSEAVTSGSVALVEALLKSKLK